MAGYSQRPLAAKLGIRPGSRVHLIAAPDDYVERLGPVADTVQLVDRCDRGTDIVHLFCDRRAELERQLKRLRVLIRADAAIWVSWPKRASGVPTDVTEDTIRELALPLGLVDTKVCAVDTTWSGLRLVLRRELR